MGGQAGGTHEGGKAGGAGVQSGGACGKPGGSVRRRQWLKPGFIAMVNPAAMAVDGSNTESEAHAADAVAGE